jgi:hypothetical protein
MLMILFRFLLFGIFLLLAAGCGEQRHGVPAEGKVSFGGLTDAEMVQFFEENTGVSLLEAPVYATSAFKYFNDAGKAVGYTDVIVKISAEAARAFLNSAKVSFKDKKGLQFEYKNYLEDEYAGMTIRQDAPVLYWDDGNPIGERLYLEVDDESGVMRLSYSVGVERDALAQQAATKL